MPPQIFRGSLRQRPSVPMIGSRSQLQNEVLWCPRPSSFPALRLKLRGRLDSISRKSSGLSDWKTSPVQIASTMISKLKNQINPANSGDLDLSRSVFSLRADDPHACLRSLQRAGFQRYQLGVCGSFSWRTGENAVEWQRASAEASRGTNRRCGRKHPQIAASQRTQHCCYRFVAS